MCEGGANEAVVLLPLGECVSFPHLQMTLDKRAHHNELERRRRDHIKDSFHGLRDCIPSLRGEKVPVVIVLHVCLFVHLGMQLWSSFLCTNS